MKIEKKKVVFYLNYKDVDGQMKPATVTFYPYISKQGKRGMPAFVEIETRMINYTSMSRVPSYARAISLLEAVLKGS